MNKPEIYEVNIADAEDRLISEEQPNPPNAKLAYTGNVMVIVRDAGTTTHPHAAIEELELSISKLLGNQFKLIRVIATDDTRP
jgi:hypothetical protein